MSELLESKVFIFVISYLGACAVGYLFLYMHIRKAWTEDPETGLLIDPKSKKKND